MKCLITLTIFLFIASSFCFAINTRIDGENYPKLGTDPTIRHIPKYGGELWYVSKNTGSNSNDGKSPDRAFETLGTAVSAMAAVDG